MLKCELGGCYVFFALISCWRIYDVPAFTLFDYSCGDFFERYRYYSSHRSDTERLSAVMTDSLDRGDIEGLKDALKADGGIPAGVLLSAVNVYGTKAHQATIIEGAATHAAGLLKNYLNYLDVIVTLSPLMGLLGTVIGMIGSFDVLSTADGQPFAITGGVAEALVCTATGLFVAIIALIAYTYLSQQVSHYISSIEKLSSVYLAIAEGKEK